MNSSPSMIGQMLLVLLAQEQRLHDLARRRAPGEDPTLPQAGQPDHKP
jgi:hypothetical protein